jgi:hypothetical protein
MSLRVRSSSSDIAAPMDPEVTGLGASIILKKIDAAFKALDAVFKGTEMALKCAIMVIIDIKTLKMSVNSSRWKIVPNLHYQSFYTGKLKVEIKLHGVPKA